MRSQMKDDFEKELGTSAEEEAAAAEAHAKLMETKRADLALLEATLVKTKKSQGEVPEISEKMQKCSIFSKFWQYFPECFKIL